jgi:hypothetical protein
MRAVLVALAVSDFVFVVLTAFWTWPTNRRSDSDPRWAAPLAGTFGVVAVILGEEAAVRSTIALVAMSAAVAVIATFMWVRSWPMSRRMSVAVRASAIFSVLAAALFASTKP